MQPPSAGDETSSDTQIPLAYLNVARSEVLQRLALREQVLLASIATAGIIAGFGLDHASGELRVNQYILRLIPFSATAFAISMWRHNRIIRLLGLHIRTELDPALTALCKTCGHPDLAHWTSSPLWISGEGKRFLNGEALSDFALLWSPAVASIACTWPSDWAALTRAESAQFLLGCVLILGAIAFLLKRLREIRKQFSPR